MLSCIYKWSLYNVITKLVHRYITKLINVFNGDISTFANTSL